MLRAFRRTLRVWRTAHQLGSSSWADVIAGRYPADEFRSFRDSGDLYFRALESRLQRNHAEIVLQQYGFVKSLVASAGMRLESLGEDLVASLPGMRLRIQAGEEIAVLYELFVEGCYNFAIPTATLLIDIGANVAATALYLSRNPLVRVVGFEAFGPNCITAKYNLELNPVLAKRITLHNVALGAVDGVHSWNFSDTRRGSSGAFPIPGAAPDSRPVEVRMANAATAVRDAITASGSDRVIAKIDCEGGEFDIIECLAEHGVLKSIAAFAVEWHRRAGRDPQSLVNTFTANGFTVFTTGNDCRETGMLYAAHSSAAPYPDGHTTGSFRHVGASG